MDKKQLIQHLNENYKSNLSIANTSFSSINKSKEVWWFNISVSKFNKDLNLLLNANQHALWLHLPEEFVKQLSKSFKIREDKNAVDIEISADKNSEYLKDIKSGGSGFNFAPFIKLKIDY